MIIIDSRSCIGCSACIKDCPTKALRLNQEGKAEPIRNCIQCGHCVAICPENAVSIPEYDMNEVEAYDEKSFSVNPENFLNAVKFRRSIRNFSPKPLSRETLSGILNAGRYTATAKNQQDCRFVLVQEHFEEFKELFWNELPAMLEKTDLKNHPYYRALQLLYKQHLHNPSDDPFFFNGSAFLVISSDRALDAGLAAANIENMAAANGAGALYCGYLQQIINRSPILKNWLDLGDAPVACCMLLGYPNVTYRRTAPRKKADILWK